jgi:hypothetical protein
MVNLTNFVGNHSGEDEFQCHYCYNPDYIIPLLLHSHFNALSIIHLHHFSCDYFIIFCMIHCFADRQKIPCATKERNNVLPTTDMNPITNNGNPLSLFLKSFKCINSTEIQFLFGKKVLRHLVKHEDQIFYVRSLLRNCRTPGISLEHKVVLWQKYSTQSTTIIHTAIISCFRASQVDRLQSLWLSLAVMLGPNGHRHLNFTSNPPRT